MIGFAAERLMALDHVSQVAWRSVSDEVARRKAMHFRVLVSRAADQLPGDRPGVVHVGYEAVGGNSADGRRHELNRREMRTFKAGATGLRMVYGNDFTNELVTGRNETAAVIETMACYRSALTPDKAELNGLSVDLHGDLALILSLATAHVGAPSSRTSIAGARNEKLQRTGVLGSQLTVVAGSVNNPPDPQEFEMRVRLVVDTSGDLPAPCWTRQTRATFARRKGGAFWPSDSEVDEFLRPLARALWRKRAAILAMRDRLATRTDAADPVPTAEEREAIIASTRAKLGAAEQERRVSAQTPSSPIAPASVTLSGEALWNARNRARAQLGEPLLARPDSFEGFGR